MYLKKPNLASILSCLSESDITNAVRLIDKYLNFYPDEITGWTVLRSRWTRLERKKNLRTESEEIIERNENKWIHDVTDFLQSLGGEHQIAPFFSAGFSDLQIELSRPLRIFVNLTDDLEQEKIILHSAILNFLEQITDGTLSIVTNIYPDLKSEETPVTEQNADLYFLTLWWQYDTGALNEVTANEDKVQTVKDSGISASVLEFLYRGNKSEQLRSLVAFRCNRPFLRPVDTSDIFSKKIIEAEKVNKLFDSLIRDNQVDPFLYDDSFEIEEIVQLHIIEKLDRLAKKTETEKNTTNHSEKENTVISVADLEKIRKSYLNWLVEQHAELELRGIGGDGRLSKIPLEKVYVALKGFRTGSYEIEQSDLLHTREMQQFVRQIGHALTPIELAELMRHAERRAVVNNPLIPSMVDTHRDGKTRKEFSNNSKKGSLTTITLADAFRSDRKMVILGDPGSGKTTLARWIVLQFAKTLLKGQDKVIVPKFHVDPNVKHEDKTKIELGPSRIPVLIRIAEFAEAYLFARKKGEILKIVDFIGKHSWLGQFPDIDGVQLNQFLKQSIEKGEAVIILDGMDEVTVDSQRDEMVKAIEQLIKKYIDPTINPFYKDGFTSGPTIRQGAPVIVGGNQIVITSRIAGYQRKTIGRGDEIAHVTIKPMSETAVRYFCDAWCRAVVVQTGMDLSEEKKEVKAKAESEALKTEIFRPDRIGVRELATNPLMVTILALVYRKNKGHLPEQRSQLYELAMKILIEEWRITGLKPLEIEYVLSPLAAHIHENYATGLIEEDELREIIYDELAVYRNYQPKKIPPDFDEAVDEFIIKVKKDVGILAERSEQLYGFLHLTFQEYLAALNLIKNRDQAVDAIIDRLDDPRWREPILLALGYIGTSRKWGPRARGKLLKSLLSTDDATKNTIPRCALFIANSMREMVGVPTELVEELCMRLLRAAAYQHISGYSSLLTQIEKSLANIYQSSQQEQLEQVFAQSLEGFNDDPEIGFAIARLIRDNNWFPKSIAIRKGLIKALPQDRSSDDFPIFQAIKKPLEEQVMDDEKASFYKEKVTPIKEKIEKLTGKLKDTKKAYEQSEQPEKQKELKERIETIRGDLEKAETALEEMLNATLYRSWSDYSGKPDPATSILPLRAFLEDRPEIVDFINQDFEWQRLIGCIYGGFTDGGIGILNRMYQILQLF